MRDGSVSQYDFGGMNLYISGCNEVGDATFFIQFLPDQGENNTELWRLDRSTGEKERIATWYNEMQKMQQRNHKYKKMPQGSFLLKKQKLV